ncbi:MAG: winged helix-turn-helix domain-containing protein [Nanoarchaeota archaeon]
MGVIERIFHEKRDVKENNLEQIFESLFNQVHSLKNDFHLQRKWINHLHDFSLRLNNDLHSHREAAEDGVDNLKGWIDHLHYNQGKQQKDLEKVEESVTQMLVLVNKSLSQMQQRIEKLENVNFSSDQTNLENKPAQPTKDTGKQISASEGVEKSNQNKTISFPATKDGLQNDYSLTNPENRLLNLLLSQADPISYSKIAELTGNSINTVRVVMNNLKKKGFVEENVLPNGGKLFNVMNKEKIRKLYNITPL